MRTMASQISGTSAVCSTVCLCAHHRKHQSSASLTLVDLPHKGPANNAENVSIWWRHHGMLSHADNDNKIRYFSWLFTRVEKQKSWVQMCTCNRRQLEIAEYLAWGWVDLYPSPLAQWIQCFCTPTANHLNRLNHRAFDKKFEWHTSRCHFQLGLRSLAW